jgi:uracil-DNA glycosylase
MTTNAFNYSVADASWHECLQHALSKIDPEYLKQLTNSNDWLPGRDKIFSAFSLPVDKVEYVLFGESPYPRRESANGYAFWDAAVNQLWSANGLDKKVNRATSLRNMMKMMLVANGTLNAKHTGQEAIAALDKTNYITTNHELFTNLLGRGFLLLNASPVLQTGLPPQKDAKAWQPFIKEILTFLLNSRPQIKMVLFGKIAAAIDPLIAHYPIDKLYAEHPYNLSFITNPEVLRFFKEINLLAR